MLAHRSIIKSACLYTEMEPHFLFGYLVFTLMFMFFKSLTVIEIQSLCSIDAQSHVSMSQEVEYQ